MTDAFLSPARPELTALFLCARRELTDSNRERLSRLLDDGVDWRLLWREGAWHGLIPCLRRHLESLPRRGCPDDLWRQMRAHSAAVAVSNARLLSKLSELRSALDSQGIALIALKGPVLAHRLYGDLAIRPSSDLDILVRPEDAATAVVVLRDLGFSAVDASMIRWQSQWIRTNYEMQFANDASDVRVDLHWRWFHPHYRFAPDQESIWSRSEEITMNNGRFRTLNAVDDALFLVLHAARHDWEALRWLMDIAELLRSLTVEQWQAIEARAAEWRVQRKWLTCVALCERHLALRRPEGPTGNEDPHVQSIVDEVTRRWNRGAPDAPRPVDFPWRTLFYRSLEWPADRRRLLYEWVAKPSASDWDFCSLPQSLWHLYLFLRPLRAAVQRLGEACATPPRRTGLGR